MKSKKIQNTIFVAQFSNHLFWDVDKSKLDVFKYPSYVIDKVLSHGLLSDWYLIKEIYGKEAIKQVVLQQRHLSKYALAFCVAYFNEPITNFRCYNYAQSNPTHWNY